MPPDFRIQHNKKTKNMSKTKAISAVLLLMFIGFLFVSSVKQDMSQGQGQGQGQVNSDPVTECYNKCTVSQFVEYKNKLAEEEKEKAQKKEQMSKILQESSK